MEIKGGKTTFCITDCLNLLCECTVKRLKPIILESRCCKSNFFPISTTYYEKINSIFRAQLLRPLKNHVNEIF